MGYFSDDDKRDMRQMANNLQNRSNSDLARGFMNAMRNGDQKAAGAFYGAAYNKAKNAGGNPEDYMKGGGGCFITTAVCDSIGKPDDCYELTMFRSFRDNWLVKENDGAELIERYYRTAPTIVKHINARPDAKAIYLAIWANYLAPCLKLLEQKNYAACKSKYVEMVETLANRY